MPRRKKIRTLKEILDLAKRLAGHKKLVLVGADQDESLKCVFDAHRRGLIEPLLIGDRRRIKRMCRSLNIPLGGIEIIEEPDTKRAAKKAVAMCRKGQADILMKGNVNTDVMLRAILDRKTGLERRGLLSYVSVFESPIQKRLMFMSDPSINIAPNLDRKVEMVRNAIWVAQRLGFRRPKVAVLTPTEKINAKDMPATVDADIIAKMGESEEIADADIAGPCALDVAISRKAAKCKNIEGPVAGRADILVCPDLNSGNILYKALTCFAGAEMANALAGVESPVVMASRSDSSMTKLYTMALSVVLAADEEL